MDVTIHIDTGMRSVKNRQNVVGQSLIESDDRLVGVQLEADLAAGQLLGSHEDGGFAVGALVANGDGCGRTLLQAVVVVRHVCRLVAVPVGYDGSSCRTTFVCNNLADGQAVLYAAKARNFAVA